MTNNKSRRSRYHSNHPEDAEWRMAQAHVDADIEGLSRAPVASKMVEDMVVEGIGVKESIKRLKVYFLQKQADIPRET
ncbi:MAG: hypothetical protein AAGL18_12835 [Pseudomonadota bacterium]